MINPLDAVAGRWLAVEQHFESAGRLRLALRVLRQGLTELAAEALGGVEAKRRSQVRIVRRDNGALVARFDHTDERESFDHVASLRARLAESTLTDFTRELGIDFDLVRDAKPLEEDE